MGAARNIIKTIVILISAALAIKHVMELVEDYLSFPTSTLYVKADAAAVQTPAFTICPKPSANSSYKKYLNSAVSSGSTMAELFKNASVSLLDVVLTIPRGKFQIGNSSTVNGETIIPLQQGFGYWSERTFSGIVYNDPIGGRYFKCFTLFLKEDLFTGPRISSAYSFTFDFSPFSDILNPQIEVFIHDKREKYTKLHFFEPEQIVLFNNTISKVSIRPEVIQKLSRKYDPCIMDEDYSYTRCMENCFWERFQSNPDIPCVFPSLMTKDVNLTATECKDAASEVMHFWKLYEALADDVPSLSNYCDCPKRCNATDYYIFGDTSSVYPQEFTANAEGQATLLFRFPSKRVPHFLEKEKVTLLDLLSNIGGIVGVCLGLSLITLFDILELMFSKIQGKIRARSNEVIDSMNQ